MGIHPDALVIDEDLGHEEINVEASSARVGELKPAANEC